MVRKVDWPPLLAPGRHCMSLYELKALCVDGFEGPSLLHRECMFFGLERMVQEILSTKLPCHLRIDGSYLTKKPDPGDIDVVVVFDFDVSEALTEEQRMIIDVINGDHDYFSLDSSAWINYNRDHKLFGGGLSADSASDGFGVEHGDFYLKGFAV